MVEYAIALIVVTTVGASGALTLAKNASGLMDAACQTTGAFVMSAAAQTGSAITPVACTGTGNGNGNGNGHGSGNGNGNGNGNGGGNGNGSGNGSGNGNGNGNGSRR